jgi:hypothetical protein
VKAAPVQRDSGQGAVGRAVASAPVAKPEVKVRRKPGARPVRPRRAHRARKRIVAKPRVAKPRVAKPVAAQPVASPRPSTTLSVPAATGEFGP